MEMPSNPLLQRWLMKCFKIAAMGDRLPYVLAFGGMVRNDDPVIFARGCVGAYLSAPAAAAAATKRKAAQKDKKRKKSAKQAKVVEVRGYAA